MGTRSITTIIDSQWGKPVKLCTMYRQYDGYPSGHGKELSEFLSGMRVCNGYGTEQAKGKWANGAGCLAAQMVAHFKDGIGGIYLTAPRTELEGEDYGYEIKINEDLSITVKVMDGSKKAFEGTVKDFAEFCAEEC